MANYPEISMAAVFQNRARKFVDQACVGYKNSVGVYEDISWKKMNELVWDIGCYLLSKGLKHGNKASVFSTNRYEWWVADLAILSCGAANSPNYPTNSAKETHYVLENSDSRICFAGTKEHLKKVLEIRDKLPQLIEIVIFDDLPEKIPGVITFKDALDIGRNYPNRKEFDESIRAVKMEDLASIIYTSGTTGNPKGVMLQHKSVITNIRQCYSIAPKLFDQEHTLLSFLPLSHAYEKTEGFYMPLYHGKKVAFAEDFATILTNFQEVRPSMIVCVPRLFEKIHTGIMAKAATAPPMKKRLFSWALGVAKKNLPYVCNNKPRTSLFAIEYALADKLVFSKIKKAIGMDKLDVALSGGGPLAKTDAEFFLGMDIRIFEGYGLTETGPVATANRPDKIKPGFVGSVLVDTEVKISEEGEVMIKGPQLMLGYYKNEAATKEVFTDDGFFHSGDIGVFDSDGFLKITGRIKDLIITSQGKNISPQNIENSIKGSRYIEQVAVIGDNKKYLTALLVPAFTELEQWAKDSGIIVNGRSELIKNNEVIKLFEKELQQFTTDFARVEQIRKFRLLTDEWSQETDELTPTLKLKRRIINNKYAPIIEEMYPKDDLVS